MGNRTKQTCRHGLVAAEVAIVLPLAFMFMVAIFDVGRAIATRQLLDGATRAAARQAVVGTTTLTTSDIQTIVTNYMGGMALQGMDVQVYQANPTTGANIGDWTKAANGQCIAVQVTGNFVPIIPKFSLLTGSFSMSSKALTYCEAN